MNSEVWFLLMSPDDLNKQKNALIYETNIVLERVGNFTRIFELFFSTMFQGLLNSVVKRLCFIKIYSKRIKYSFIPKYVLSSCCV